MSETKTLNDPVEDGRSSGAGEISIEPFAAYLKDLQERLCHSLEEIDGGGLFERRLLENVRGGESEPRVLEDGPVIERASVLRTRSRGRRLSETVIARRPELAGRPFEASSLSAIAHPRNPFAPTAHLNLRCFWAGPPEPARGDAEEDPVWWFGGGFDLTPCYGFDEDAVHWHRTAREACDGFGVDLYPRLKEACDEYFRLPHRDEQRGIGGLLFEDLDDLDGGESGRDQAATPTERFARCCEFVRSVGDRFLPAYLPILERRKDQEHEPRHREFQLYRRGRYVEFNLLLDRGTRYGLESGVRVESVLASMPPLAAWRYDWRPEPGSAEERLGRHFLRPRDWLANAAAGEARAESG